MSLFEDLFNTVMDITNDSHVAKETVKDVLKNTPGTTPYKRFPTKSYEKHYEKSKSKK